mmetsp:Transcript_65226/g.154023  ORF Transcript_65226/g.154023 Transcript_65226/m.154023 type:complete len:236 (+) Transcript_65226:3230-3937(+)
MRAESQRNSASARLALEPALEAARDHEQARDEDHGPDDLVEMLLDPGHIAEQVADQGDAADPEHAATDVIERELAPRHLRHAGHKRREGAQEGHETRRDDGDATVLLVEVMRLHEGGLVEEARVLPLEHPRPEIPPDRVVALVAEDGRRGQQRHRQAQVHQPDPAHRADDEEQRVARQEGHHHHAGLDKDDQEQQRIDPGAVGLHEGRQMLVDVEDEVEEEMQQVHGARIIPAAA